MVKRLKTGILHFLFLLLISFMTCTHKEQAKDVVFQVGDKYVTDKEFNYRAMFTIHPNLPTTNRNLENVFLNNMILEKVLVDKFGKQSELNRNEEFHYYIQGRKEQAMREQLFYTKAYDIVNLDSTEIKTALWLSKREYNLEFFNIYNDSTAKHIAMRIKSSPQSAEQIFNAYLGSMEHPTWTAKWRDPDNIDIHDALFSAPLTADSILGPIKVDDGQWIMIKVVNWRDVLDFGGEDRQAWQQLVTDRLTMNHAVRNWQTYTRNVMKGKEIDFNRDMFKKVADLFYDMQNARQQNNRDTMRRLHQNEDSTLTAYDLPNDKWLMQQPFMTIDITTWTVGDLRRAMMSHPLVYRKTALDRGQFYLEFRKAVAALVRDTYLNKEAYKMKLDKNSKVRREAEMWSDALVASFERNQLLNEFGKALPDTTDPLRQTKLSKMYEDYLTGLVKEYYPKIKVNDTVFNRIEFNKTQLFVTQPNLPYPVTVPKWPMLTNNNVIDYLPLKTTD